MKEKPTPAQPDYLRPTQAMPKLGTLVETLACAALGVMLGLVCAAMGFGLGGAGHGWTSAAPVSLAAVFAYPGAGVAWGLRRRASGKGLGLLLVAAAVVANALLVSMTIQEGKEYFDRVCSHAPGFLMGWAALWAGWQAWAVAAVIWLNRRQVG